MHRWIDPRKAIADQYPGYDISELDHLVDDDPSLHTKHIPERTRVLFETPSGFAIYEIDSGYLYDPDSNYTGIEAIWANCVDKKSADFFLWPKGFLKLDNRSTAISAAGIDQSLAEFIEEHCNNGVEKIIVGESAYKDPIENLTGITCVCDDDEAVKELMWGLQNLLRDLVPEDKSGYTKQDRKYHSEKLLAYLRDNVRDCGIKPEMINGEIALLASIMWRCDVACKEYSEIMHSVDNLMQRCGLKTNRWDVVTHATALMTLIGESVVMPEKMFTCEEKKKILEEAGKYKEKIFEAETKKVYKEVVRLNTLKYDKRDELMVLLRKAEAASKGIRDSGEMLTELQVFG